MDRMNGKVIGGMATDYQSAVVRPMVDRVKKAKSLKGLLRQLGPGLVREMDTGVVETALGETANATTAIGIVSAQPKSHRRGRGERREG
jgi:hypothetical protein